jgi:putative ABC transport system ATP-binding protein
VVRIGGVDLREVPFDSLRERIVLVPQEGFLFDATLRENLAYGRLGADDPTMLDAIDSLGLSDWIATLPFGLDTRVGQRGESLSAGERQLVALVRAQLADPEILVLDEATSAVDPQLEMRISAALDRLTRGRTSVTIAHRMTTAQRADIVVVVDRGRIVQQGSHDALLDEDGVYARLWSSWVAQHATES